MPGLKWSHFSNIEIKKSFKQKTENFIKLSIQNYQNDFQKWFFIDKENNPQSPTFEIQSNWYHSERYFNILNTALTSIHIQVSVNVDVHEEQDPDKLRWFRYRCCPVSLNHSHTLSVPPLYSVME